MCNMCTIFLIYDVVHSLILGDQLQPDQGETRPYNLVKQCPCMEGNLVSGAHNKMLYAVIACSQLIFERLEPWNF